jgi:hypothetical protein
MRPAALADKLSLPRLARQLFFTWSKDAGDLHVCTRGTAARSRQPPRRRSFRHRQRVSEAAPGRPALPARHGSAQLGSLVRQLSELRSTGAAPARTSLCLGPELSPLVGLLPAIFTSPPVLDAARRLLVAAFQRRGRPTRETTPPAPPQRVDFFVWDQSCRLWPGCSPALSTSPPVLVSVRRLMARRQLLGVPLGPARGTRATTSAMLVTWGQTEH